MKTVKLNIRKYLVSEAARRLDVAAAWGMVAMNNQDSPLFWFYLKFGQVNKSAALALLWLNEVIKNS